MIKETIVAQDMAVGMKLIKETYGEDALILATRNRRSRRPGSLHLIEEVEIDIAMGVSQDKFEQELQGGERRSLPGEIQRLEDIISELELQLEHTGGGELEPLENYPPGQMLLDCGVREGLVRQLAHEHAEEVPPVDQESLDLALARIGERISCVEDMRLQDLRGFHALLGSPGVGKTSLALRLAQEVARGGDCRVVVLSYNPGHPGEAARLEQRAEQGGFEAALAPDREALLGAIRYLADRDLLILDMPPHRDGQWSLLEEVEQVMGGEPLLKHLVVAADGAWRGVESALGACDFLAVTRADLGEPLLPALDLARGDEALAVTFTLAGAEADAGIALATSAQLLSGLKRAGPLAGRAARGGGR